MKGVLLFLCIAFLLKHKVTYASLCNDIKTQNVHLHGATLGTPKVNTIFQCYRKCEDNIHCASINMNQVDKTCELKHSTKTRHQHDKSHEHNTMYMEIRDALGSSPQNPILSCKWFKSVDNHVKSGVYWMKINEPSSAPFQVFCDMTTDGGGWTLVYSYAFTQFNTFATVSNAITPIPTWPVSWSPSGWVPQSTTAPLSESSRSAMDFAMWKKIGNEFLLKPNITNWVACVEGTGSLVNWVAGSLICRMVKVLTPTCTDVLPTSIKLGPAGPYLYKNNFYIYFDGMTDGYVPSHDPCGTDDNNYLTNVPNPGGVFYVR